jgi:hypothetical protein
MAKVNNPIDMHDADKEDALLVAVTRDNKVFFGTDLINPDDLTQKIKDKLANRTDKPSFSRPTRGRSSAGWSKWWTMFAPPASIKFGLLTDQKKADRLRRRQRHRANGRNSGRAIQQ